MTSVRLVPSVLACGVASLVLMAASCSKQELQTNESQDPTEVVASSSLTKLDSIDKEIPSKDPSKPYPYNSIDLTLTFRANNGVVKSINLKTDLQHKWAAKIISTECNEPLANESSTCQIKVSLDPTSVDLGQGTLELPYGYVTASGTEKTGHIDLAYSSDNLRWKSAYTQYDNGPGYYQDSAVILSQTNPGIVYFAAGNVLYAMRDNGIDSKGQLNPPVVLWTKTIAAESELRNPALNASETAIYVNSTSGHIYKISGSIHDQDPTDIVITASTGGPNNDGVVPSMGRKPVLKTVADQDVVGVLSGSDGTKNDLYSANGTSLDFKTLGSLPASYGFLRSSVEMDLLGNLYVGLSSGNYTSSAGDKLFYKVKTDGTVGSVKTTCAPVSSPTIAANGVAYIGTSCGTVEAFDFSKDTPEKLFTVSALSAEYNTSEVMTKPALSNDGKALYFGTGVMPVQKLVDDMEKAKPNKIYDNTFYSVDATNGNINWCYRNQTKDNQTNLHDRISTNPVIGANGIVFTVIDNVVMAFDPAAKSGDAATCNTYHSGHNPFWTFNIRDAVYRNSDGEPADRPATTLNGVSSNPVLSHDGSVMYVMSNEGYLNAINVPTKVPAGR